MIIIGTYISNNSTGRYLEAQIANNSITFKEQLFHLASNSGRESSMRSMGTITTFSGDFWFLVFGRWQININGTDAVMQYLPFSTKKNALQKTFTQCMVKCF